MSALDILLWACLPPGLLLWGWLLLWLASEAWSRSDLFRHWLRNESLPGRYRQWFVFRRILLDPDQRTASWSVAEWIKQGQRVYPKDGTWCGRYDAIRYPKLHALLRDEVARHVRHLRRSR